MKSHFIKRIHRNLLHSQTNYEILERLDTSYLRFFKHLSKRPPKFKNEKDFNSFVYSQSGYSIGDNVFTINKIHTSFKFSKSRDYEGNIKRITIKRNRLGEYFICLITDAEPKNYGKTLKGASVGIDFGLKTYLTLSDGTRYENPLYMKESLTELSRRCKKISKCKKYSNNKERNRKELDRLWNDICNKRDDFQWKLAHELCRKYDYIFIEDLNLADMKLGRKANRKLKDQAHGEFVAKLQYVATKYGVVVHTIERYYPSSKTCTCGYINKDLKLTDRVWTCPHCGTVHNRDLLAANNILRRGIYELESDGKTKKHIADGQLRYHPTITRQTA